MNAVGAVSVLFMSVIKFMFAAPVSYGFNHSYLQTMVLLAIGGSGGTLIFFLLGKRVMEWFRLRYVRKKEERLARGLAARPVFTRTNRWIIRMKRSYGMFGLAVMPPILSIPITAVLAAKYFKHDRRTLPVLVSAVVVWSVVLSTAWGFIR
ncbi:MAG: hypothetical protein IPI81_17025 [Flavobacteriales bacterium]|nr:hypothetical protein [Flavobacteriales bacterium]MCC6938756.1 hypothetical protein [Flavobacteriales bacterium]